jgi:AcrR family transcriptional regulator
MADIAEATGVSVGTLYNYFESKEAVLRAIMDQYDLRLDDQLNLAFDSDDPTQQLAQLIVRAHGFTEEHREVFQLYSRAEFDQKNLPEVAKQFSPSFVLEKVSPRIRALLEQCLIGGRLRTDIPLEVINWSIQATLHALLLEWFGNPDGFSLTHRGCEVVALFIAGTSSRRALVTGCSSIHLETE